MLSLKLLYKTPLAALISGRFRKKKEVMRALDDPGLENDPLRAEYVKLIPEAQIFRGVLFQGYLIPPDLLEGLEDMPIRNDDVFIVTYPKSGTTWTEEILSLIYKDGDVSKVMDELLVFRVHHLEVGRPFGQLRFLRNLRSPRLMATHLPLQLLPKQLRQPKCKIIYVVRNPKDTAVSYFHHHRMSTFLGNYSGTWDKFLVHFMAGHVVYGSWFDHVLPYWEFCKKHPDNVFFVSYEEMKLDFRNMILKLAAFLQRPLTAEAVDAIVKHCSFDSMKSNKMVNKEQLPISDLFDMSKTKFMRKGIVGDWKNHFTEEQSSAFDEFLAQKMASCDLPLVFEPDHALQLLLTYGRIIHNHPEKTIRQHSEDPEAAEDAESEELTYKPSYFFRRAWLPYQSLHVQQDPLTIDMVE